MSDAFDHGELNIPGRTSSINRQLDAHKANQQRLERAARKQAASKLVEQKAEARQLLEKHGAAIVARHGQRFGVSELRNTLDQWVKWEPKKLIDFVRKFQSEAS